MSYTAEDIKTLSFRDGVRTRIQMYLGSADNEGAYQAIKEIVNNATDVQKLKLDLVKRLMKLL